MRRRSGSRVGVGAAALVAGVLLAHSAAAVEWIVSVTQDIPGTFDIIVEVNGVEVINLAAQSAAIDYYVPLNPGDDIAARLWSGASGDYDLVLRDEHSASIDSSSYTRASGLEPDVVAGICDDAYEGAGGNDSYGTAYDLTTDKGVWLGTINGMGVQLDYDFYKIVVQPGSTYVTVDCQFTHLFGNIDIELYDASGIYVPFSRSASLSDNELINGLNVVTVGYYYIRVETYPTSTVGNTYNLMWTTSSTGPSSPVTTVNCSPGAGGSSLAWLLPLVMAAFVLRRKVGLA